MSTGPFDQQNLDIDAINQNCYDHRYLLWDRFPFADILPAWIIAYHSPCLGDRALDIGSGTGRLAKWLQDQGFEVLCLDPSPQMCRLCRDKGLTCLQMTVQSYQDKPASFSLVLAILSLIHVPKKEWQEQLDKIAALLKPNGFFLLAVIEGRTEGVEERASGYPRFFAHYTRTEIKQMTEAKFEVLNFKAVSGPSSDYLLFALKKRAGA
ncbi:class I SAM-dependent methyltransferase [Candidatus Protochlamydia phocaeensis]|uniref:class I SAM-dependent methyltransferase n=1 Tax=Candidatus Protochlamydia phocaeensis TaxID=1414722 RepID=UPI0008395C43|nr:class I SAM-dependent methyltransferase [Candidatus Protochlamydia phocaeensis]